MEAGVWILISSMSPSTLFHTLQQTHCSLGFDQNISHAMDVFSVMYGTAKDINMLIEFLPGYLYPNNEDGILEYGVLGVSQGAHAVWMSLFQQGHIPISCEAILIFR